MMQGADLEVGLHEAKASTRVAAMCLGPESGGRLEIRTFPRGRPAAGVKRVGDEPATKKTS